MRLVTILLGVLLLAPPALVGCGPSLENAAAKDPQKCERDPKCKKDDKSLDCSTQCADDPACVDRCREIQTQTGTMGR